MSKVYRKNRETRRYELKHRMTLVEIALITFLLAILCQLAVIGLAAASGGWTGILARLVKVEVLKTVGTAIETARNGFLIVAILIVMISAILLGFKVKKAGSLSNYLTNRKLKKAITKALVDTLSVNTMKEQAEIEVPDVEVTTKGDEITVEIERLAGMYDMDNIKTDVNSSFKDKYSDFVVTTARVADNETKFIFVLENVGNDKTFIPRTLEDLNTGDYRVKLQEGLTINLEERPHIAIFGKTGSKKTTTLQVILLQLALSNAEMYAVDGKDELRSVGFIFKEYAADPSDILRVTDSLIERLNERQTQKPMKEQAMNKTGLKASECGFKPIVLVTDEVSAVLAAMDKKQQAQFLANVTQIVMKGRSLGIFWILANQDPSTNVFPQAIRSQFTTKILLGNANQDTQKMALGEVETIGDIEDFRGYYMTDGLTKQPQKFFVPNIFEYGLNNIETFRRTREGGERRDRN